MAEPADALTAAESAACIDALARAAESVRPVTLQPDFARRCSLAQARSLHAALVDRTLARIGGSVLGFKLGGTTQGALDALGLPSPFVGPIFSVRTHPSPAALRRADFIACIVEAEIGVRIGRAIGGSARVPGRDEVADAIDLVFPAIEIADSRLEGWAGMGAAAIVADLGYAGAWVRGVPYEAWRALDLPALAVTLRQNGEVVRTGSGALALGDPLHALALTIAELGRQGRRLEPGELVSTGSCTVPLPSAGGGRFDADFGPLGRVAVELA